MTKLQERLREIKESLSRWTDRDGQLTPLAKDCIAAFNAAEAEIARLKEAVTDLGADVLRLHKEKCDLLYPETAAQPPAVGEDVVETIACASYEEAVAAKRAILREKYPDWASLPEEHREAGRALGRFIAKRLASASLLRTKDAG